MKEYLQFISDKKIITALGILLVIEFGFQIGIYKTFLKKNSYASNINRITEHVVSKRTELDPDILIVGTSVAFEGLSVRILNEELSKSGWKIQSIAIRGSEIIVQHRVLEEYLDKFPNVKYVIHVLEPGMAWVDRKDLVTPTLSMLSELGNWEVIPKLKEFEYDVKFNDYMFLLFKSIAYRKDLSDLFTNFNERIKAISRNRLNPNKNPWDYENDHPESMEPYGILDLDDCMKRMAEHYPLEIPKGSNKDHRRMIFETCAIANDVPKDGSKTENTERYFRRLHKMYSLLGERKIHIINVFAPYSDVIRRLNSEERMRVWDEGLRQALSNYQNLDKMDLQDSLGADNAKYSFDLIHLNQAGMQTFSKIFARELEKKIGTK